MKPQHDFPLLETYSKFFKITPTIIFAYDNCIYSDYKLTPDLLIHETVHLKQQNKIGLDKWVFNYLHNPIFRLNQEIEAYIAQINSIKDKNQKYKLLLTSAEVLSSDLYGNIISYNNAIKKLQCK